MDGEPAAIGDRLGLAVHGHGGTCREAAGEGAVGLGALVIAVDTLAGSVQESDRRRAVLVLLVADQTRLDWWWRRSHVRWRRCNVWWRRWDRCYRWTVGPEIIEFGDGSIATHRDNRAAAVLRGLARTVGAHEIELGLLRVAAAAIVCGGARTVGAKVIDLGLLSVSAAAVHRRRAWAVGAHVINLCSLRVCAAPVGCGGARAVGARVVNLCSVGVAAASILS